MRFVEVEMLWFWMSLLESSNNLRLKLSMIIHEHNLHTQEADRGKLRVQDYPLLYHEILSSQKLKIKPSEHMFMGRVSIQDTKSPEYPKKIHSWDSRETQRAFRHPSIVSSPCCLNQTWSKMHTCVRPKEVFDHT